LFVLLKNVENKFDFVKNVLKVKTFDKLYQIVHMHFQIMFENLGMNLPKALPCNIGFKGNI
jgi:hypothetical protein